MAGQPKWLLQSAGSFKLQPHLLDPDMRIPLVYLTVPANVCPLRDVLDAAAELPALVAVYSTAQYQRCVSGRGNEQSQMIAETTATVHGLLARAPSRPKGMRFIRL